MRLFWGVALVAIVSAGCSNGTECGKGTFRDGHKCRPFDPNERTPPVVSVDPPQRTRFVDDVTLTTDEPATIYYTIDGSVPTLTSANEPDEVVIPDLPDDAEVTFFAVDRAGNASDVVHFTWEVDRTGPGIPRSFDLTLAGNTRTVTWTNPKTDDLAGIVVARVEGFLVAPTAESVFSAGQDISTGVTVVYTGVAVGDSSGSFTESLAAGPGIVRYAAWAYDDLGNFGTAGADHVLTDIPAQTGKLTINATTGTVAVTQAPANIGIKGTAEFLTGTLTLDLEIENLTSRVLFAPKVLMTNLTGTTGAWNDSDGTFDTELYRSHGAAIAPGAAVSRIYTFTGVTITDILATDIDIRFGHVFGTTPWNNPGERSGEVMDEAALNSTLDLDATNVPSHSGNNGPGFRAGGITPEGYYVVGARNHARIFTFDLTSGALVGGFKFSEEKSSTLKLVLDPGGATAYVLYQHAHPYAVKYIGAPGELLRVDPIGLQVNGRVDIGNIRGAADLELSPNGRFIAIAGAAGGGIVVVNVDSFRVAARLDVPYAGAVAWDAETGDLIAVSIGKVRRFSTTTWEQIDEDTLPLDPGWSQDDSRVMNAGFGNDGRLWVGRDGDLQAIDLDTGVSVLFGYESGVLEMFDGEAFVGDACNNNFYHLDNTGVEVAQYNLNDSHCSHGIARSPF